MKFALCPGCIQHYCISVTRVHFSGKGVCSVPHPPDEAHPDQQNQTSQERLLGCLPTPQLRPGHLHSLPTCPGFLSPPQASMSVDYIATLSSCFGSGTLFRDWDQSGVTQHKADTDTLEQGQGLGCRDRILSRKNFMHLERAMAWDTQTLMGRQRGVLAVDRDAGSPKHPAYCQSCADTDLFFPSGHPLDQPHWATTGSFPGSIHS